MLMVHRPQFQGVLEVLEVLEVLAVLEVLRVLEVLEVLEVPKVLEFKMLTQGVLILAEETSTTTGR